MGPTTLRLPTPKLPLLRLLLAHATWCLRMFPFTNTSLGRLLYLFSYVASLYKHPSQEAALYTLLKHRAILDDDGINPLLRRRPHGMAF